MPPHDEQRCAIVECQRLWSPFGIDSKNELGRVTTKWYCYQHWLMLPSTQALLIERGKAAVDGGMNET